MAFSVLKDSKTRNIFSFFGVCPLFPESYWRFLRHHGLRCFAVFLAIFHLDSCDTVSERRARTESALNKEYEVAGIHKISHEFTMDSDEVVVRKPLAPINVVFIVLDGVRGEEFFNGAEDPLSQKRKSLPPEISRRSAENLMPFLRQKVVRGGRARIFGNRAMGEKCLVDNRQMMSLPAYANIFAGVSETGVLHNRFQARIGFPTIIDSIIQEGISPNNIAVFASWGPIQNVVSRRASHSFVLEAGWRTYYRRPPWRFARYDEDLMDDISLYLSERGATNRFIFIAFNNADEWAHLNNYPRYVKAIRQYDEYIGRIFQFFESNPQHHDRTLYIITTDHGRGEGKKWSMHGAHIADSQYIWALIYSPLIPDELKLNYDQLLGQVEVNCSHIALHRLALGALRLNNGQNFPLANPVSAVTSVSKIVTRYTLKHQQAKDHPHDR
jgi:Metalloenzyme superfamily